MSTKKIKLIPFSFIMILASFLLIPKVQAQQPMDMTACGSGTTTTIVASEEMTIMSVDVKGICMDNLPSKSFDNMTYHTAGLLTIAGGKLVGTLYAKYMDPSGDFVVIEISQVGLEYNWKFLSGTGKWKGITGGGKGMTFTRGKPISPGTSQGCLKITGTYELKK